jgi:KR domain
MSHALIHVLTWSLTPVSFRPFVCSLRFTPVTSCKHSVSDWLLFIVQIQLRMNINPGCPPGNPAGGTGGLGLMTGLWLMEGKAISVLLLGRSGKLANPADISLMCFESVSVVIGRADVSGQEESRAATVLARAQGKGFGHVIHAAGLQVHVTLGLNLYTAYPLLLGIASYVVTHNKIDSVIVDSCHSFLFSLAWVSWSLH